jgi:hypothetical protein
VKIWFQILLFRIHNLYRYDADMRRTLVAASWNNPKDKGHGDLLRMVGLYKLNAVDPSLESAW